MKANGPVVSNGGHRGSRVHAADLNHWRTAMQVLSVKDVDIRFCTETTIEVVGHLSVCVVARAQSAAQGPRRSHADIGDPDAIVLSCIDTDRRLIDRDNFNVMTIDRQNTSKSMGAPPATAAVRRIHISHEPDTPSRGVSSR